jgi:hypothetical protein
LQHPAEEPTKCALSLIEIREQSSGSGLWRFRLTLEAQRVIVEAGTWIETGMLVPDRL